MKTHARAHLISTPEEIKQISIPVIDFKIPAGKPTGANDVPITLNNLSSYLGGNPDHTFAFVVDGNSMSGSGIKHGDVLIVDRTQVPKPSSIVVFELNGEFTVKKFERKVNFMYLVPTNPEFQKIKVKRFDSLRAWGIVKFILSAVED